MERSGIREQTLKRRLIFPDSAALHPGYKRKEPGVSKAEALQQAQITLLNDPRYHHPSYWGPFLLIGNWL
jgi:CHAT domain-containing protein